MRNLRSAAPLSLFIVFSAAACVSPSNGAGSDEDLGHTHEAFSLNVALHPPPASPPPGITTIVLQPTISVMSVAPAARLRPDQVATIAVEVGSGTLATTGQIVADIDGSPLAAVGSESNVSLVGGATATAHFHSYYGLPAGKHTIHVRYQVPTGTILVPRPNGTLSRTTTWSVVATSSQDLDVVAYNAIAPQIAAQLSFCLVGPNEDALTSKFGAALDALKKKDPVYGPVLGNAAPPLAGCVNGRESVGLWTDGSTDPLNRADGLQKIAVLPAGKTFAFFFDSALLRSLVKAKFDSLKPSNRIGIHDFGSDPGSAFEAKSYALSFVAPDTVRLNVGLVSHLDGGLDLDTPLTLDTKLSHDADGALVCSSSVAIGRPAWAEAAAFFLGGIGVSAILETVRENWTLALDKGIGCSALKTAFPPSFVMNGATVPLRYETVHLDDAGILGAGSLY